MIVSKSALQVVNATAEDNQIKVLDNVHIEEDGSVIASNRESVVVVTPIRSDIREKLPLKENDSEAVTISSDTIKELIRFIGVDKQYNGLLEHCDIVKEDENVKMTCYDSMKRPRVIQARAFPGAYFPYLELIKRIYAKKMPIQIKVNRVRFANLLMTIEKVCGDNSDFAPLYIEFSEDGDMIVRAESKRTGQKVIAVSRGLTNKNWLEPEAWEKKLIDEKIVTPTPTPKAKGNYIRERKRK